ncbi:MAG: succinate dehydrogenase cytochrome b-556 subunit [Rickettsiales bacterium]|jgi:succinate dehydrogenase / fumarate reductase cytochrome b subunit|nr:succinate dehydrogenase cytochrome b-556 subunit [Rickettsiales bacterium]
MSQPSESSKILHKDRRPLSPHLTIYKPQISTVLSILHRLTGVGLFLGALFLSWGIIAGIYGCNCLLAVFGTVIGKIFLFGWSWALFFHLCTGIRHLFWDMGKGFALPTMAKSGIFAVIMSFVLTAASWIVGLGLIGGGQ